MEFLAHFCKKLIEKPFFRDMEENVKNSGHFFHTNPYVYEKFKLEYLDNEKIFFSSVKSILVRFQKYFNLSPTCFFTLEPPYRLNNYFSTIASELQGKINHFGKDFSFNLKNNNPNNIFY